MYSKVKNQLKNVDQVKKNPTDDLDQNFQKSRIEITSFQDLINQATREKEVELKYDLERNVKLVSFNRGKIDISFNEKLNKNFIKNLTEKLLLWTGDRWIISLSKNNIAKSIYEKELEVKSSNKKKIENSEFLKELKKVFPDVELIDIKENYDE